jgi:nucleoid DNA-binding protein
MNKLILNLLKENGRLIIPDFGALIVKQKAPFKVIFNEFLQYNDGALIAALSDQEKISQEEAAAKIKQLTAEFNKKLNAGEQIKLPKIGLLSKSQTGKITLSDPPENEIKKTEKENEGTNIPEENPEEKVKNDIEFEIQEEPEKEETKETEQQEPIKKEPIKEPETRLAQPEKKITTQEPVKKQTEQSKTPPVPKSGPTKTTTPDPQGRQTPPITEYYNNEPQRNWTSIILWIVVIIVVNGAIFGFFFFGDEIKTFLGKNKSEMVSDDEKLSDNELIDIVDSTLEESPTVQADTELLIEDQQEENTEAPTEAPIFSGTKYYVVAGVFRDETNADNLAVKLRKEGYNAEKFGKIGQMYAVSYDVFPTKKEADSYMMKIKREVDKDTWIRVVD